MHLLYRSNNLWKAPWSPLVSACQWPSSQPLLSPQLSHNNSLVWQGLRLWPGALPWWKCHWPDLKSAGLFPRNLFLSSFKTSTCNPNPNPLANQLWCIDFFTPPTHTHHPSQTPCLTWISYATQNWCTIQARCSKSSLKHSIRFCGIFSKFKTEFHCISFLLKCPHVQIAFFKFSSCDN